MREEQNNIAAIYIASAVYKGVISTCAGVECQSTQRKDHSKGPK